MVQCCRGKHMHVKIWIPLFQFVTILITQIKAAGQNYYNENWRLVPVLNDDFTMIDDVKSRHDEQHALFNRKVKTFETRSDFDDYDSRSNIFEPSKGGINVVFKDDVESKILRSFSGKYYNDYTEYVDRDYTDYETPYNFYLGRRSAITRPRHKTYHVLLHVKGNADLIPRPIEKLQEQLKEKKKGRKKILMKLKWVKYKKKPALPKKTKKRRTQKPKNVKTTTRRRLELPTINVGDINNDLNVNINEIHEPQREPFPTTTPKRNKDNESPEHEVEETDADEIEDGENNE